MAQRCKNVPMCQQCWCKNPIWDKIFAKFTLFCWESEQWLIFTLFSGIFWHILELYVTFGIFRHYLGLLGLLCFFGLNIFRSNHVSVTNLSFCMSGVANNNHTRLRRENIIWEPSATFPGYGAVWYSVLKCVSGYCNVLWCVAMRST